jgi:hypothetical protein
MKKLLPLLSILLLAACGGGSNKTAAPTATPTVDYSQVSIPAFNADSAYQFVADQVAFGFRTPNTKAQTLCANYLARQMGRWCDTVIVQDFPATLWDGTTVRGKNIIASIEAPAQSSTGKRLLLAAHWDSRLWADHDENEDNHRKPILGANAGASGVGVLMEMARVMADQRPRVSIDFIFFDVEDQGVPEWTDVYEDNSWCKGSQYWGQNRHLPYYNAVYGILFDMVGTHTPRFTKEQVSVHFAPGLTDKLWQVAAALGYGNIFVNQNTDPILDDHLYINQLTGIPTADIVQNSGTTSFFKHWHTTTDDLQAISPESMRIVANVVLKTIYSDFPTKQ